MTELVAAMVAAMAELENIPKANTAKVGSYSYSYADLGDTLTYVRPILARHGLGVSQEVTGDGQTITVFTIIWHTSGESHRSAGLTMRAGVTAQETGSAITYARRYSLLPALGLATEDDDGAQASQPKPPARTAKQIADDAVDDVVAEAGRYTYKRLKELAGTPISKEIKAFAAKQKRSLAEKELVTYPEWRAIIDARLLELIEQENETP